jgi:hypothetical protein
VTWRYVQENGEPAVGIPWSRECERVAKLTRIAELQGHAIKNKDLLAASGAITLRGPESFDELEEDEQAVSRGRILILVHPFPLIAPSYPHSALVRNARTDTNYAPCSPNHNSSPRPRPSPL